MEHTLNYKNPPQYSSYRRRHQQRHGESQMITSREFTNLSSQDCHYCGVSGPNGVDRVDSKKGYGIANCVPCCKHCNYVKGNLSQIDFETWAKRFVNHQTMK